MQNLYKIKKPENIWNPMHHKAQHQSRIKLEHDFHIAKLEHQIMVLNEKSMKTYAKPI